MTLEEQIKELTDINFRILTLLGFATSIVMSYKELEAYHDDTEKVDWFLQSLNNVIYLNKPLAEMP